MQNFPSSSGLFQGLIRNLYDTNQLDKLGITASSVADSHPERIPQNVVFLDNVSVWTSNYSSTFGQWIQIELKDRFLRITDYAIGLNGTNYPRSWNFTVSMDGIKWKIIHYIKDSEELKGVKGKIFHNPYGYVRFFKWINQGPNGDDGVSNSNFYIKYIDLYGFSILCRDDCHAFPIFNISCPKSSLYIAAILISYPLTILLC